MATSEQRMYSAQSDLASSHSSIPPLFLYLLGASNVSPLFLVSELLSVHKSAWHIVAAQ